MPAPVYKTVIVASSRPRRPESRGQPPVLPTSHAVKDDSWTIFGLLTLVVCGLIVAFYLGRATVSQPKPPVANIALASPPPPTPAPVIRQTYPPRRAMPTPVSFTPDYVAPRVTVTAPAIPRPTAPFFTPIPVATAPSAPVDYAARDRRIHDLQSQIDAIDAQILQLRSHPDSLPLFGTYNGHGYRDGDESPFKKLLDQLDLQRNELRRQKWQLEGR